MRTDAMARACAVICHDETVRCGAKGGHVATAHGLSARQDRVGCRSVEAARLGLEHHRDAVPDRVAEAVGGAAQFDGSGFIVTSELQRPLADRADQKFDQAVVHGERAGGREGLPGPRR